MKVKELIAKLQTLPQEAECKFMYDSDICDAGYEPDDIRVALEAHKDRSYEYAPGDVVFSNWHEWDGTPATMEDVLGRPNTGFEAPEDKQ